MKLVRSLPRPLRRHNLQLDSQSLVGELISVLHGMYCLAVPATSIVSPSSVSSLASALAKDIKRCFIMYAGFMSSAYKITRYHSSMAGSVLDLESSCTGPRTGIRQHKYFSYIISEIHLFYSFISLLKVSTLLEQNMTNVKNGSKMNIFNFYSFYTIFYELLLIYYLKSF